MTNYRRRRKKYKRDSSPRFNVNTRIRAKEVRLINEEGMLGIMSIEKAKGMAEELEMDLVEINPKASPPVVKLVDYNKFKYQLAKAKEKQVQKKDKLLRVSVRVSDNDLKVRAKKADDFLQKGMKVRLQVQMKRREKAYPDVAKEVMDKFLDFVESEYKLVDEVKLTGDSYFAYLTL